MTIICKPSSEIAPQVHLEQSSVTTGGTTTPGTFRNAQIATITGSTAKNYYYVSEDFFQTLTKTNASGNSNIANYPTITRNGVFQGTDTVLLQRGDYIRQLNLNYTTITGATEVISTGIASGSNYLRYSTEWLASVINGNSSVYSGTSLNPSCWLAGEDLTGIPYSNTDGGQYGGQKNSGMITPRHLPGVEHFKMSVGTVLTFSDGSTRTIIGRSAPYGDALMYVLNADVSAGTKVYPVPGRWLFNISESGGLFTQASQFVAVRVDQFRIASFLRVCDFESGTVLGSSGPGFTNCPYEIRVDAWFDEQIIPQFTAMSAFYHDVISGDSGSAIFFKVASGLTLGSVFTTPLSGPFMDENFANALIVGANDNAVANGHARPTDYTVTVAPDPTA
jgi:hypothetical protein